MQKEKHFEIERKYLIRYPDLSLVQAQPNCTAWEIVQIYLTEQEPGITRRIRQVTCDGETRYFKTSKRKVNALSCEEVEQEITQDEYIRDARECDPARRPIVKTRYRLPHEGHILELDVYPFWTDRAILEIELDSENEAARIPNYLTVIREVSGELAYKNRQLAVRVPHEEL